MPKPKKPAAVNAVKSAKPEATPADDRRKDGTPRTGKPAPHPDRNRVAAVERLVASFVDDLEIVRLISRPPEEGGFGCSERTVRADLARVWATIQASGAEKRERRVNRARYTAEVMFRRHIARNEGKIAAGYFDKLCRIDGAYAPDAIRIQDAEADKFMRLTEEQLDEEIRNETRKLLEMLPPERRAAVIAQALEAVDQGDA
jgi:hypothetical protein